MSKIGELLVQQNKISERDVERTLLAQNEMGDLFGQVLVKLGLVSDLDVAQALSEQLDIPLQAAADYPEQAIKLDGVAQDFLFSNAVVPVALTDETVTFAATVPQDPFIAKALAMALDRPVKIVLGLESDINKALQQHLQADDSEQDDELSDQFSGQSDDEFIEHLRDLASEAPVIRLVNQIIHRAVDMGASDIHIEPFEDGLQLRYRVDGVLQDSREMPAANLGPAIASRIKLLSHMNIAERRLPQDGRIMTRVKGHEIDLRVSTIPTVHGESIVMRVLDRGSIRLSLTSMGFSEDTLKRYQGLLDSPHGVLLVTGPTGSGKTTTLYASLASLDSESLKIITVEDPVEYQLDGVNQIQVQPQIELSFARALRAILRQDPDIIMIGEMRDTETAQIGVQSALTGHLVLSTLHTNTAAGAITRLEDMGVERYLITSSVNGVLAQRLVRTLCKHCKTAVELSPEAIRRYGLKPFLAEGQSSVYQAKGCEHCLQSGYAGRTSIHELFVLDEAMHRVIMSGADATLLHAAARKQGMITLYEDGLRKVVKGDTSLEEVMRVTQDQSESEDESAVATAQLSDLESSTV
ncbi:Flp pilus assembly complex ATPase component TadA [Parahaliea sp. F7430]|uniref:Flp pilus assembly complex ATPase component TadA n=1 Tax=Sediminihaliea albiluteola TaxID=2758564 RepID=A0A7W2TYF5_9GAMM|nr:GspE/PulE family protein [Sediminihaliea albiluteola]MBA6414264.1 Flp pilus assembly complex ATPase component TadA [Sediminihaliea albiluteola]